MRTLLEDLKKLKNDYESIEVMLMLIDDTYIKYEDIEEPLNDIPEPGVPNYNESSFITLSQNDPSVPLIDEEIFKENNFS